MYPDQEINNLEEGKPERFKYWKRCRPSKQGLNSILHTVQAGAILAFEYAILGRRKKQKLKKKNLQRFLQIKCE